MNRLFKKSVIVILLFGTAIYLPSCKKEATPPVLTTTPVSGISQNTAITGGTVVDDGGAEITAIGVCWATSPNPTISSNKIHMGKGLDSFTSIITDLTTNTKYYVRAYATNSAGTSYGNEVIFTTKEMIKAPTVATLTTTEVTSITLNNAVSGGNITSDGDGTIAARGVCWSIYDLPTIADSKTINGAGKGSFSSDLTLLSSRTTYYIRAYAINEAGIAYGNQLIFTTASLTDSPVIFNPYLTYGSVTDVEENIYKIIQIGTQLWMAENLKTTKYNDGISIPNITDFTEWSGLTAGAYCWYYNDAPAYKAKYGALYNWFAVKTGKLCPTGWHVPSDGEWIALITYLGGDGVAGGKLKETGNTHWQSHYISQEPVSPATNESGFTALPGGTRNVFGDPDTDDWSWIGMAGYWWSTSESIYNSGIYWAVINNNAIHTTYLLFKQSGFSVRCIKD